MSTTSTQRVHLEELLAVLTRHVPAADEAEAVQPATLEALKRSGYLGAVVPARYGGLGEGAAFVNSLVARVSEVDPSTGFLLLQHSQVCARILEWGTADQQRELLPLFGGGQRLLSFAWGSGSQRSSVKAVRSPDGSFRLCGKKLFVTGAGLASMYMVLAVTGGEESAPGADLSFFLVSAECEGLSTISSSNVTGMRGTATGTIQLDGCVVPEERVLGPVGAAARLIPTTEEFGIALGAVSVGIAQAALDFALETARRRGLEGNQAVQRRIARMAIKVQAARALMDRIQAVEGRERALMTRACKAFAAEVGEEVCREAQHLAGGGGYLRGSLIERLRRDADAVGLLGPVTDKILDAVGRELLSRQGPNQRMPG